jgi:DNA-binding transcriptional MerR regulator
MSGARDPADAEQSLSLTIDELAHRTGLPTRTIREYQTMGLLPPPERRGRIGVYAAAHLGRLDLIHRLQLRGYSLAGIGDLLVSWRTGADLGEVLGLAPDELVHIDEPGAPASREQLAHLLPDLVPERLDDLVAVGVVEVCGPQRYCVPSPSLLQLAMDMLAAGYGPDRTLGLLTVIASATDSIADAAVDLLQDAPSGAGDERQAALNGRGRGLLAHGVGRLTVRRIGRRLGITDEASTSRSAAPRGVGANAVTTRAGRRGRRRTRCPPGRPSG